MPRRKKTNPITIFGTFARPYTQETKPSTASSPDVRWSTLRSRLMVALADHPEARAALTEQLAADLGLNPDTRIQI